MRKNKLFNLSLIILFGGVCFAQQPTADVFNRDTLSVTIDGHADDLLWDAIPAIEIERVHQSDQPTLNSATWKAAWDTLGLYVLVEVSDDIWEPSWESGLADWLSDKIELYIDVTNPQKDGSGASGGNGNHQVAPNFSESETGTPLDFAGKTYGNTYDGSGNYIMEYFIPFELLPDNNGLIIDPRITTTIGFDVTVIDLDDVSVGRNRAAWANSGAIDESWNNMDDVGLITFSTSINELKAIFSAGDRTIAPGNSVQFTDYSYGTPITWLWDFGDGNTSIEQNPLHAYNALGAYTVSLTVTDANDSTHTTTKSNYITISEDALEPLAAFNASITTAKTNQPISFSDESLYSPTSWTWYFGDGGVSTEQNPTYAYRNEGTYSVTLVASNINGNTSVEKSSFITVTKGSVPSGAFSSNKSSIKAGDEVQFTDESTNYPSEWEWNFGDGKSSNDQHPVHTYHVAGNYNVSLTVTNSEGSHTVTKDALIQVEATANNKLTVTNTLKIYPNPSNGIININYSANQNSDLTVRILDISGKEVKSLILDKESNKSINLSEQQKGLYFIVLQTDSETLLEKVLIH